MFALFSSHFLCPISLSLNTFYETKLNVNKKKASIDLIPALSVVFLRKNDNKTSCDDEITLIY